MSRCVGRWAGEGMGTYPATSYSHATWAARVPANDLGEGPFPSLSQNGSVEEGFLEVWIIWSPSW